MSRFKEKEQEKHENRSTTPLLVLKTPTSVRASRKVAVDGTTTVARVKPRDEGGNILNETIVGSRDRCRGMSGNGSSDGGGTWNDNDNRYVVVVCLRESYSRNVFLGPSGSVG